jgi:hypothetical protein
MADKPKQVGLGQPAVSRIFHSWFEGGEASLQEKIDIQEGKKPLPPNCRFRLDCNTVFDPPVKRREDGDFLPWPDWTFELLDPAGNVLKTAVLGRDSYAEDGFVSLQSPEREDGVFQLSMGYAPIFQLDAPAERSQLRITARVGDLVSPPQLFPWVAKAK